MTSSNSSRLLQQRRRHSLDVTSLQSVGLLSRTSRGTGPGPVRHAAAAEVDVLEETSCAPSSSSSSSSTRRPSVGSGRPGLAATGATRPSSAASLSLFQLRSRRNSETTASVAAAASSAPPSSSGYTSTAGLTIRRVRTAEDSRTTSYEEELELRLEHVRMRAVNAEQRLALERLKRRQLAQRLAEVERTNSETLSCLGAQAEQRIERFKSRSKLVSARCDQLRQDARTLEERLRETERRAAEEKQLLEARLAALQELLEKYTPADDSQAVMTSAAPTDNTIPLNSMDLSAQERCVQTSPTPPVVDNKDLVWCGLYEILAEIAFSRVRYLERARKPFNGLSDLTPSPHPDKIHLNLTTDNGSAPASPPSHYYKLRRTSSCPSIRPEDDPADAVNSLPSELLPGNKRTPNHKKTSSVDLNARHTNSSSGRSDVISPTSDDVMRSCLPSVDSEFRSSASVSPCPERLRGGSRDDENITADDDDDEEPFSKSLDGGGVDDVSADASSRPVQTPPKTKRHSSLHLDIFRKIQTGVRRRDRPSSAVTVSEHQRRAQPMRGVPVPLSRESTSSSGEIPVIQAAAASTPVRNGGRGVTSSVPSTPLTTLRSQSCQRDDGLSSESVSESAEDGFSGSGQTREMLGGTLDRHSCSKSSFGRLQNRRNGLIVDPVSGVMNPTGGVASQHKTASGGRPSKLDQFAKNFKTYLHTQ